MEHLSTRQVYVMQPDGDGHFGKSAMRALRDELRCHHTGKTHSISSRLVELVYRAAHHFDNARVLVVAGYRAPRVARAKGNARSHHREGIACDFRLDGVPVPRLRDWLRAEFAGMGVGIGWYPNSGFVHLDVNRKKDGYWIDYSGPGERARYQMDSPDRSSEDLDDELPPHAPPTEVAGVEDPGL